jgi:hypothetical protein
MNPPMIENIFPKFDHALESQKMMSEVEMLTFQNNEVGCERFLKFSLLSSVVGKSSGQSFQKNFLYRFTTGEQLLLKISSTY